MVQNSKRAPSTCSPPEGKPILDNSTKQILFLINYIKSSLPTFNYTTHEQISGVPEPSIASN